MSKPTPSVRAIRVRGAKAILTGLLTAALAVSFAAVATPAHAATETLNPANEINGGDYTITLDPPERTEPSPGFSSALQEGPSLITIDASCPEGNTASSRNYLLMSNGERFGNGPGRGWTIEGDETRLEGLQASAWTYIGEFFVSGTAQLVITCDEEWTPADSATPIGDAMYFVADIEIDATAQTWRWVQDGGENPGELTETSTTLAPSSTTATSTTLTADVRPLEANGQVKFSRDGVEIGRSDVIDGVATYGASGLTPGTTYTFTAEYLGDTTHEPSSSGTVQVTTLPAGEPADTSDTNIGVEVPPTEPGTPQGLKITVNPDAVTLEGPGTRNDRDAWVATGALTDVTVTDDRPEAERDDWTLSGQASEFTAGEQKLGANNLSWTPSKVSGHGTQGAAASDLSQAKELARGGSSTGPNVQTTVRADLSLTVPATAAGGDYTSKLTLTLI